MIIPNVPSTSLEKVNKFPKSRALGKIFDLGVS